MSKNIKFKEALLKAKNNDIPKFIQDLLDLGLIQECETIDGIYYINFAYYLIGEDFFNYKNGYVLDFSQLETFDVLYIGGLALNNKGKILKGIIHPYYLKGNLNGDNATVPYTLGTPQIFYKSYNLSINDLFIPRVKGIRIFNLLTNFNNVWADFLLNKASYENTNIIGDNNGKEIYEPQWDNDITFFGKILSESGKCYIKPYFGSIGYVYNSFPIFSAEEKLQDRTISSKIANMIYCQNRAEETATEAAKINKEGMKFIGSSIVVAGLDIRKGTSNIANALNQHPDCIHYK